MTHVYKPRHGVEAGGSEFKAVPEYKQGQPRMHKTLSQKKLFGLISCSQNLTNSFSSAIFSMKGHVGFLPGWDPLHVGLLCFSSCRLLSVSSSCVITVPVTLAVVLMFQGPNSGTDRQGTEQSVS